MTMTDKLREALEQSILDLSYYIHLATKVKTNNKWIDCEIYKITMSLERLEKALAHLTALEKERERQLIETAPRDGRMFLVMFPRMMNLVVRARYNKIHGYFVDEHENGDAVSRPAFYHEGDLWIDIPAPPTIASCKRGDGDE